MPSWAPTVAQVSALVPTRAGQAVFDADTIPTAAQVASIIGQICDEVVSEVGGFDPTVITNPQDPGDPVTLGDLAKWAATLGAATYVELGFYPEQQPGENQGAGGILYTRYQTALTRLRAAVDAIRNGRQGGPGPLGSFPPADCWPL
jgi:hypothetical protein